MVVRSKGKLQDAMQDPANKYQIESNVEFDQKERRGRPSKYPLGNMKIGDSFFVPYIDLKDSLHPLNVIRSTIWYYGKRNNKKFKVAHVSEEKGFRVWRTK